MILAAMASFVAAARTPDERQPIEDLVTLRTAWKRGEAAGRECKTIALVSHVVSSQENYYVLVRPTTPGGAGVLALFPEEDVFERGDIVAIEGVAVEIMHHAGIKVTKAEKIRQMTLDEAKGFKPPDFRRGILHARRIAAIGEINDVNFSNGITTFNLFSGKNSFVCRMKGELSQEKIGVKNVRVTGCALNHYGESSDLFEPILDIAGDEDIEIPAPRASGEFAAWGYPKLVDDCSRGRDKRLKAWQGQKYRDCIRSDRGIASRRPRLRASCA